MKEKLKEPLRTPKEPKKAKPLPKEDQKTPGLNSKSKKVKPKDIKKYKQLVFKNASSHLWPKGVGGGEENMTTRLIIRESLTAQDWTRAGQHIQLKSELSALVNPDTIITFI